MINNNNVEYYPSYENDGCLGALCNNANVLVAYNMQLNDTKRDDYLGALCNNKVCFVETMMLTISNVLVIYHHLVIVTIPNIMT